MVEVEALDVFLTVTVTEFSLLYDQYSWMSSLKSDIEGLE